MWDPANGKELTAGRGSQGPIGFVAFALDGKAAITGSWADDTARVWDLTPETDAIAPTGRHGAALPVRGHTFAVSPDGRLLALGAWGSKPRLVNLETGREVNPFPVPPTRGTVHVWFTPDSKSLILLETDHRTMALWDIVRGKELRRFVGHQSPVDAVAMSPDGKLLASSGTPRAMMRAPPPGFVEDTATRLWDVATGKELRQVPGQYDTLAFSPDGTTLAGGHGGWFSPIALLDVSTGRAIRQIDCARHGPNRVAFSPDGKAIASAGRDGTVRLWEVATGGERCRFVGHTGEVYGVAFSPDGRRLLSGGADTTALLWSTASYNSGGATSPQAPGRGVAAVITTFRAVDAAAAHQAICQLLAEPSRAVRSLDQAIQAAQPVDALRLAQLLADLDSEQFGAREHASSELNRVGELAEPALRQFLQGKPALEGRKRAELLLDSLRSPAAPGRLLALRAVEVLETIGSPDARRVLDRWARGTPTAYLTSEAKAALTRLERRLTVRWSPPTRVPPTDVEEMLRGPKTVGRDAEGNPLPPSAVTRLGNPASRPNEHYLYFLLTPDGQSAAFVDETAAIRIIELPSGRLRRSIQTGHLGGWGSITLSPDGTRFAGCTSGGSEELQVWDCTTNKKLWQVDNRAMKAGARFSHSGAVLATAGGDRFMRLWDTATGKELRRWPDPNERTLCLAFSPDGKVLASAGQGNLIRIWDTGTGRALRTRVKTN